MNPFMLRSVRPIAMEKDILQQIHSVQVEVISHMEQFKNRPYIH